MKISVSSADRERNPSFSKIQVDVIMRRNPVTLTRDEPISAAVRLLIKHKVDAVLAMNCEGMPIGVVTKTEIMGAYFAGMHLQTPLGDIMGSPVIHCGPDDSLESALVIMQDHYIHRVYVIDEVTRRVVGTLAYPDVIGALYRFCRSCNFSLHHREGLNEDGMQRLVVADVMSRSVAAAKTTDSISEVIDKLASFHLGALLIVDPNEKPVGVISKTDLALAYLRGTRLEEHAEVVMRSPVIACDEQASLEEAIRRMIFSELSRLFVATGQNGPLHGVLTLSDAARARSGSCQACSTTRIIPKA